MSRSPSSQTTRVFLVVWLGQLVSLIGSGLTGFALGVWVYQRTGSVTQFALIALFATFPAVVLSPIAGALVDRWDRRRAMILSDSGAGLATAMIAVLLWTASLQVWEIYLLVATISVFGALRWPAYSAATSLLVPQQSLGRANGLIQMAQAVSQILSPLIAAALLGVVPIQAVVAIDFGSFLFAITTLLIVCFPSPPVSREAEAPHRSLLSEAAFGWTFITARQGLFGLLLFFAATNFLTSFVSVLATPLLLSMTSVSMLGIVLSIAGSGMLIGSLVMSAWGGPRRRINGVLGFMLLDGCCLILGGLQPSVPLLAMAAFLFFFGVPIIGSCSQTIWQSKVPLDIQGRVFAVRSMIAFSILPLANLLAGPLTDRVFEPLMAANGLLAPSVGQIIGVGPGRGIGLLFTVLGILTLGITLLGYRNPRIHRVEEELPDVIGAATFVAQSSPVEQPARQGA